MLPVVSNAHSHYVLNDCVNHVEIVSFTYLDSPFCILHKIYKYMLNCMYSCLIQTVVQYLYHCVLHVELYMALFGHS